MTTATIAYDQQGSGPDLVLLHGWGLNRRVWQPLRPWLTPHARLWLVDLPGFGESPWVPEDNDFEHYCAHLGEALADQVGPHFHLLGWSLGGLIASQLALTRPALIQTLTLLASSPCFVARENWPGIQPRVLNTFRDELSTDFQGTIQRFLAVQALGSPDAKREIKTMRELLVGLPEPRPEALVAGLRFLAETDLRSAMREIAVPVQRIYGRRDSLVPANIARDFPGEILTGSAHAPFLTEPARVTELVSAHIQL